MYSCRFGIGVGRHGMIFTVLVGLHGGVVRGSAGVHVLRDISAGLALMRLGCASRRFYRRDPYLDTVLCILGGIVDRLMKDIQ